jgi:hypothetical protein
MTGKDEGDMVSEIVDDEEEKVPEGREEQVDALMGDVDDVQGDLQNLIDVLRESNDLLRPRGSRHVSIAITHLEEARLRLRHAIDSPDVQY